MRRYLEALGAEPRRGRRRTPASIPRRLAVIDEKLAEAEPLTRLHLLQEKKDLEEELARAAGRDLSGRLKQVREGGQVLRRAQGHQLRRLAGHGVSAAVLQKAGIARARGASRPTGRSGRPSAGGGAAGAAPRSQWHARADRHPSVEPRSARRRPARGGA